MCHKGQREKDDGDGASEGGVWSEEGHKELETLAFSTCARIARAAIAKVRRRKVLGMCLECVGRDDSRGRRLRKGPRWRSELGPELCGARDVGRVSFNL